LSCSNENDSIVEEKEIKELYKSIKKEIILLRDLIKETNSFPFFNLRASFPYLLALDKNKLSKEEYSNIYIKSSWFSFYISDVALRDLLEIIKSELQIKETNINLLFIDPSGTIMSKALYAISCYFIGTKIDNLKEIVINYQTNYGDFINYSLESFYNKHLLDLFTFPDFFRDYSYLPNKNLENFKKILKKIDFPKEKKKIVLNFINGYYFYLYPSKTLNELKKLKKEKFFNVIFYNPSTSYDNYKLIDDKIFVPYVLETEEKAILLPFNPDKFKSL